MRTTDTQHLEHHVLQSRPQGMVGAGNAMDYAADANVRVEERHP
jgi:hypothetical protein